MIFFYSNSVATFTVVQPKGTAVTQSSALCLLWYHISTCTGAPRGYMVNEKFSRAPDEMRKKSSFGSSSANQFPRKLPNESLEYL